MTYSIATKYQTAEISVLDTENSKGFLQCVSKIFKVWKQRHVTRQHLAAVSAHALVDIGLTESQRLLEVNKKFWER